MISYEVELVEFVKENSGRCTKDEIKSNKPFLNDKDFEFSFQKAIDGGYITISDGKVMYRSDTY